jgi:hypothetical protein
VSVRAEQALSCKPSAVGIEVMSTLLLRRCLLFPLIVFVIGLAATQRSEGTTNHKLQPAPPIASKSFSDFSAANNSSSTSGTSFNVEGFYVGMQVRKACNLLQARGARQVESMTTRGPLRRLNGCLALDEEIINSSSPSLEISIIAGEVGSVEKRILHDDYDSTFQTLAKRYGRPTESGSSRIPGESHGVQRSATWKRGKIQMILGDRTADYKDKGFVKLIDVDRF